MGAVLRSFDVVIPSLASGCNTIQPTTFARLYDCTRLLRATWALPPLHRALSTAQRACRLHRPLHCCDVVQPPSLWLLLRRSATPPPSLRALRPACPARVRHPFFGDSDAQADLSQGPQRTPTGGRKRSGRAAPQAAVGGSGAADDEYRDGSFAVYVAVGAVESAATQLQALLEAKGWLTVGALHGSQVGCRARGDLPLAMTVVGIPKASVPLVPSVPSRSTPS